MAIIRRAQYGLPAVSPAAYIGSTRGVKVHYLGTPYSSRPHSQCAAYVRQIRESHLANKQENYSDIAYNYLVCEHGDAFEGRGVHKRTGANGTAALNTQDYAVCALLGSSGLTEPTTAMLHGIRDAIEELREHGDAGDWIGGHRDGHPTSCPGDPLYAWVKRGAPRPGKTTTIEEDDMTPEERKLLTDTAAAVKRIEAALARLPWTYKGEGDPRDMHQVLKDIDATIRGLKSVGLTPAQIDTLVDKIGDSLAARLAN